MNTKFCFLLLAVLGLFMACESDSSPKVSTNGYEYEILDRQGGATPAPGDFVYFHGYVYVGDELVNSSRQMNQEPFLQMPSADGGQSGQDIGPVGELLPLLGVGDSARVKIFMDSLPQPLPGYETAEYFHYYVVPQSIKTEQEFKAAQEQQMAEEREQMAAVISREPEVRAFAENIRQQYLANQLTQLETSDSGLKYMIHEPGTGAQANPGTVVSVQYLGMLTDGTIFDQSFQRGEAISFPLAAGRVIAGWDEGLTLLKEGGKASFFIPSELAYGPEGREPNIPADAELIFYVELEKVQ